MLNRKMKTSMETSSKMLNRISLDSKKEARTLVQEKKELNLSYLEYRPWSVRAHPTSTF
jgi:hypothetical protein